VDRQDQAPAVAGDARVPNGPGIEQVQKRHKRRCIDRPQVDQVALGVLLSDVAQHWVVADVDCRQGRHHLFSVKEAFGKLSSEGSNQLGVDALGSRSSAAGLRQGRWQGGGRSCDRLVQEGQQARCGVLDVAVAGEAVNSPVSPLSWSTWTKYTPFPRVSRTARYVAGEPFTAIPTSTAMPSPSRSNSHAPIRKPRRC